MLNDQQWDDYIRRQPGTFWGEQGKKWDKEIEAAGKPPQPNFDNRPWQKQQSIISDPKWPQPDLEQPSEPLFQWVDRLIERIPRSLVTGTKVILAILGALVATAYSTTLGVTGWVAMVAGAVAGYIVPAVLFILVKIALFFGLILLVVAFFYVVVTMLA